MTTNHNGKLFRSLEITDYLRLLAVGKWPVTSVLPLLNVESLRIIVWKYSDLLKNQLICGCMPSAGDQWLVICRHQTWSDHESEWETIQISRNFKLFAVACCRQVANDYCLTATKGGATTNHSGNVFRPLENTDYLRLLAVGWWLMTNDLPLPKVEWPRIIMGNYSELWKLQIICGCLLSASCQWLVSCRYQRWSRHES